MHAIYYSRTTLYPSIHTIFRLPCSMCIQPHITFQIQSIFMFFIFSLFVSCHQKDPDPVVISPKQEEQKSIDLPPPPPAPITAILPSDPWAIHPTLSPLKDILHNEQWAKLLKKSTISPNDEQEAILRTWAHREQGTLNEAAPLLAKLKETTLIPKDMRDFLRAEILISMDSQQEAYTLLKKIPTSSIWYTKAQTLLFASLPPTEQYSTLVKQLPTAGPDQLYIILDSLLDIASTTEQRFFILKKIFTTLPKTQIAIDTNPELKKLLQKKGYTITQRDRAVRAESLMRENLFVALTKEYKKHLSYGSANETMCRIWYAYGRSLFKTNNVTASQKPLLRVAKDCKGIRDDLGAKAYYIAGKGLDRKKDYEGSAKLFAAIPENYPNHSMADDGYLLAGIGWQNIDRLDQALPMWSKQVEAFSDGDMIFEGYWRLSWGLYLSGDTKKALYWSNRSHEEPLKGDITHAMALRYWGARWKIYPNHNDPTQETSDKQSKEKGIQELLRICTEEPTHFYALLSAQLLYELAPQKLKEAKPPQWLSSPKGKNWIVSSSYVETEAFTRTKQLSELGLLSLALREAEQLPRKTATDHALFSILESKRDPILGHDRFHKILNRFAPSQFQENHLKILDSGYPQKYWSTVQAVTTSYRYNPRIFHSLVREESSFNPKIVSWAGAKGLSQLMPATAKQVAGWLKVSLKNDAIFDAKTNLTIGSRYLNHLHEYFDDNSFMAVGSYNAGAGNMNKWYKRFGPTPIDHLVEQIPIRETRGYIKRVLGTFQLYSTRNAQTLSYPDWSRFNKQAQP